MNGIETITGIGNPEEGPHAVEPIALELSADDVDEAMQAFFEFLELPYEERIKIVHFDESRRRLGRAGYEHDGEFSPDGAPYKDNKHKFHYTQDLDPSRLTLEGKKMPHEARSFLEIAKEVHSSLAISARTKYEELEEEFPMLVGIHFPRSGKLGHHLRFLAYQASGNDGNLARGHYDKGTGTIAVAASHPGLQVGYGEHDLAPIDQSSFAPQYFTGYGWHQLAEMLDVDVKRKAGWHEVSDEGGTVDGDIS